ncbi:AAA family ATPase [Schlesneria paludicola]|uniref:AAA family ATPase n=1 Tax=Schlesneria paludicola TaxID=360056 RepID=UPI00029B062C|nr:AAA family ATPase [Schlesneria paludicola]
MAVAEIAEASLSTPLRNPFRGSVLGDAWVVGDDRSDVTTIHRKTFEKCCEAVDWVRHGNSSAGIVIHGEAGSGKTHLIRRLRHQFTDRSKHPTLERISQSFAYIPLNTHYTSLARHTRRCVAVDLMRTPGKGPSQLERLVVTQLMSVADGAGDLGLWWENLREEHDAEIDDLLFALGQREHLSPTFLRVLGHFVRNRHRLEVAGWLRGDPLTDLAYERLEIAPEDPDRDPEEIARRMLSDLMKLAGPEIPLVLCFDQVEALQNDRTDTLPFFAYAQLLVDLYAADTNLVLISCMQTQFAQEISAAIPEYAWARILSFATCSLPPLDVIQARALLSSRLNGDGQILPLTDGDLSAIVGRLGFAHPRALLDRAARRFDQIAGRIFPSNNPTLPEWLAQEWEQRSEQAARENQPGSTGETLRHGIPLLIRAVEPQWTTGAHPNKSALDYILSGPQKEAQVGIKICDDDGRRLWGQLRTLNDAYPSQLELHKLVLLRDERTPISKTAVQTLQFLDKLERKEAVFYRVPPEALIALDALRRLMAESQAGDLDFEGSAVPPESVIEWLRQNLPGVLKEMSDLLVTPHDVEPSPSQVDLLQEFLADACLTSISKAATKLNVSEQQLLTTAFSRGDLFGVVSGEPSVVFSMRAGSQCLTFPSSE